MLPAAGLSCPDSLQKAFLLHAAPTRQLLSALLQRGPCCSCAASAQPRWPAGRRCRGQRAAWPRCTCLRWLPQLSSAQHPREGERGRERERERERESSQRAARSLAGSSAGGLSSAQLSTRMRGLITCWRQCWRVLRRKQLSCSRTACCLRSQTQTCCTGRYAQRVGIRIEGVWTLP